MRACRQLTGAAFDEIGLVFNRSSGGVQQAINKSTEREIHRKQLAKRRAEKEAEERRKTLNELNDLEKICEKKYRRVELDCECGPTNYNIGPSRNLSSGN
jgi:hypothetical protein